jgi:hypothetical protein
MHTQEAGNIACALLRVVPNRVKDFVVRAEPVAFSDAEKKEASAKPMGSVSGVRMNCVDRAIIRIHFQECRHEPNTTGAEPYRSRRQLSGQWLTGWKLPSKLRTEPLPAELECKLSALNPDYKRVVVNGDVLLIEAATRRVVDVMQNANAVMAREASRQRRASQLAA